MGGGGRRGEERTRWGGEGGEPSGSEAGLTGERLRCPAFAVSGLMGLKQSLKHGAPQPSHRARERTVSFPRSEMR